MGKKHDSKKQGDFEGAEVLADVYEKHRDRLEEIKKRKKRELSLKDLNLLSHLVSLGVIYSKMPERALEMEGKMDILIDYYEKGGE